MVSMTKTKDEIAKKLAKMLYDCIAGDLDDPTKAFKFMQRLGYVDENDEWIYPDDE